MRVVLKDGPRKGEKMEVAKEGVFPVLLTENPAYAYAEYMVVPQQTVLGERLAIFIGAVKRK